MTSGILNQSSKDATPKAPSTASDENGVMAMGYPNPASPLVGTYELSEFLYTYDANPYFETYFSYDSGATNMEDLRRRSVAGMIKYTADGNMTANLIVPKWWHIRIRATVKGREASWGLYLIKLLHMMLIFLLKMMILIPKMTLFALSRSQSAYIGYCGMYSTDSGERAQGKGLELVPAVEKPKKSVERAAAGYVNHHIDFVTPQTIAASPVDFAMLFRAEHRDKGTPFITRGYELSADGQFLELHPLLFAPANGKKNKPFMRAKLKWRRVTTAMYPRKAIDAAASCLNMSADKTNQDVTCGQRKPINRN